MNIEWYFLRVCVCFRPGTSRLLKCDALEWFKSSLRLLCVVLVCLSEGQVWSGHVSHFLAKLVSKHQSICHYLTMPVINLSVFSCPILTVLVILVLTPNLSGSEPGQARNWGTVWFLKTYCHEVFFYRKPFPFHKNDGFRSITSSIVNLGTTHGEIPPNTFL